MEEGLRMIYNLVVQISRVKKFILHHISWEMYNNLGVRIRNSRKLSFHPEYILLNLYAHIKHFEPSDSYRWDWNKNFL